MGHGVARAAVEIEVEPQRTLVVREVEADAVRRGRGPAGENSEIVERARLGGERQGEEEQEKSALHSFTPPISSPWM